MTTHDLNLLQRYEAVLKYELALQEAEEDLISFAQLTMFSKKRPDEPWFSEYKAAKHHRYIAQKLMEVERGERQKLILNTAPRHGKTELATLRFAAWWSGRNPDKNIIVATYGGDFADEFGKKVRAIITSKRFKQAFPDYGDLILGGGKMDHLINGHGGELMFVGRRTPTTGRGAHLILVDDPIKDEKEARLQSFRNELWDWFTKTLLTRRMDDTASIIITLTRWNEDDIVGRLTDKTNPAYSSGFCEGFHSINMPAIAVEDDALGRKPGEALWPERFGLEHLEENRQLDPVGFSALYQCDPTPEDGVHFQKDQIFTYKENELPEDLVIYAASDHAVSTDQSADWTVLALYGVDKNKTAWVLPELIWRRMDTLDAVNEMIRLIREYSPLFWYGEKGQIAKSIEPYLNMRMEEEEVYVSVVQDHPSADKIQRSQSARARMAQGRIRFPSFAPWWDKAQSELLKFPNARFDDFVDVVSIIGTKIENSQRAHSVPTKRTFDVGTYGYLKQRWAEHDAATGKLRGRDYGS